MSERPALSDVGHLSDAGNARRNQTNQDSYRLPSRATPAQLQQKGWLFVVADGAGSGEASESSGELASNLIQQLYYRDRESDVRQCLLRAIASANKAIFEKSGGVLFSELSASILCAVVHDQQVHLAHAGDCRAYLVTREDIRLLTSDHAVIAEEDSADGEAPPPRLLTRSVGSTPDVEADYQSLEWHAGERILLCSHGLSDVVSGEDMQALVARQSPGDAVQQLIDRANERGGPDNITAVVVDPSALSLSAPIAAPLVPTIVAERRIGRPPSLVLTGVIGVLVLLVILAARGFLARDSTSSLAASLPSATSAPIATLTTVAVNVVATSTATATRTATPTLSATETPTPLPTLDLSETPVIIVVPTETATPTSEPPTPAPPTPNAEPPTPAPPTATPRPLPTSTRVPPTATPPPPPAVQPRYPAIRLREPQNGQEVIGKSVTLEFEVQTLLPGDTFELYFKRTASQTWEGKCVPIVNGKCVLTIDRVQGGGGSYDWTAVIVDTTGFVVSRLRDVSRFVWTPVVPEPTEKPKPGCTPTPKDRC